MAINIIQCFLNTENTITVLGSSLAAYIRKQNTNHLWGDREKGVVDTVVIHFISAADTRPENPYHLESILAIFCTYGVSSHYLVDREGVVRQLVPEDKKAWHCGGSIMPEPDSRQGVNEFSIGIELVAQVDSGYTDAQYDSLASLCCDIETRWNIFSYVGHEDIAGSRAVALGLRSDVKPDPGPLFNWKHFYALKNNLPIS